MFVRKCGKQTSNAKLYYSVYTIEDIEDTFCEPETIEKTFTIDLSLEDVNSLSEALNKGLRRDVITLGGRCVSPKYLPPEIEVGNTYELEWSPTVKQTVKGKAYLKPMITSRLGLEVAFGDYVELEVEIER